MAIFSKITAEIGAVVSLVMIIVISSIVLLKFKGVSGVTAALNTTIDSAVTALSEPVTWIAIVVIALIGYAVMKLFKAKKGGY